MLAMANISAARKRHPEIMVSLSISGELECDAGVKNGANLSLQLSAAVSKQDGPCSSLTA